MLSQVKAKVWVDVDNCINNMTQVLFELYNEDHGTDLRIEDCKHYDFTDFPEQCDDIKKLFGDHRLFERMKPPADTVHYLYYLSREFDLKIVTATEPEHVKDKVDWILYWFPFVKESDIIIASDKGWIESDYAIDDNPAYLIGSSAYRVLIDAPWNRGVIDYVYGIHRVSDLAEAYSIIKTMEKEADEEYEQV